MGHGCAMGGIWRRDVRQLRTVTGAVFVVITGAALLAGGQAAPPSGSIAAAQLKQIAYLKASNTRAGDHFGCGGVLDGHAGYGAALSGDGNTLAIGAPHESGGAKGVNGKQGDEVYGIGRGVRIRAEWRNLGAAGLRQAAPIRR